jgi:hypothetical protein
MEYRAMCERVHVHALVDMRVERVMGRERGETKRSVEGCLIQAEFYGRDVSKVVKCINRGGLKHAGDKPAHHILDFTKPSEETYGPFPALGAVGDNR